MNFTKKLQEDLERAEGLREPVAKAGRVLSEKNLALVMQCLDALRTLVESTGDFSPTGKATFIRMYGGIAQDAGLPLLKMARVGDVLAGHYLRAALDGTDEEFVKVLRGSQTGGSLLAGPARIDPAAVAKQVAAKLFRA